MELEKVKPKSLLVFLELIHTLRVIDFGRKGVYLVWDQYPDNKAWSKTADVRELILVGSKFDNPVDFTETLL